MVFPIALGCEIYVCIWEINFKNGAVITGSITKLTIGDSKTFLSDDIKCATGEQLLKSPKHYEHVFLIRGIKRKYSIYEQKTKTHNYKK